MKYKPTKNIESEIYKIVNTIKKRINLSIIFDKFSLGIFISFAPAFLVLITSYYTPIYAPYSKGLALLILGAIGGIIYGIMKSVNLNETALIIGKFQLKERNITVLQLLQDDFVINEDEKQEILKKLRKFNYKKRFPAVKNKILGIVILLMCSIIGISSMLKNPMDDIAIERKKFKNAKKNIMEEIKRTKSEIKKSKMLNEKEKKIILDDIKEIQNELKKAENKQELKKQTEKVIKKLNIKLKNKEDLLKIIADEFKKSEETYELREAVRKRSQKEIQKAINKFNQISSDLSDEIKKELEEILDKTGTIMRDEEDEKISDEDESEYKDLEGLSQKLA